MRDAEVNHKIRNLIILVFLAVAIAIIPISYKFHQISAQESVVENQNSGSSEHPSAVTIETLEKYVAVVAGIAEIAIVFLLWRTVKDFAQLVKVSKLQTEIRFRPWVGPSGNIRHVRDYTESNKKQYAIPIKNFGEVPSTAVTAMSTYSDTLPNRELLKSPNINRVFDLVYFSPTWKRIIGSLSLFCCN